MKGAIEINRISKESLTLEDILNKICSANNIVLSEEDKKKILLQF